MKMIILFFMLITSGVFAQSLDDLEWLVGEWVNYSPEDSSFEVWKRGNNSLEGYGLTIINGDTAFFENLSIIEKDNEIYYRALIENQNEGQPVHFKFINRAPEYIFLNRNHDFPQKIVYTPVGDTLKIILEGVEDMYEKRVDLYFIRNK